MGNSPLISPPFFPTSGLFSPTSGFPFSHFWYPFPHFCYFPPLIFLVLKHFDTPCTLFAGCLPVAQACGARNISGRSVSRWSGKNNGEFPTIVGKSLENLRSPEWEKGEQTFPLFGRVGKLPVYGESSGETGATERGGEQGSGAVSAMGSRSAMGRLCGGCDCWA